MKTRLFFYNFFVFAIILIIDQVVKELFLKKGSELFNWGGKLFNFRLATSINSNFAFSIPSPQWLIYTVVIVFFIALLFVWVKSIVKPSYASLWGALIMGGASGNFMDRIRIGGVVDFIEVSLLSLSWSSFNIADAAIVIGVFGWMLASIRKSKRKDAIV